MSDVVKVAVDLELLKYIRVTLKYAADDLTAHLDQEYPPNLREQYPTYERRHKNDYEVVIDAKYCLDQLGEISEHLKEGGN